MKTNSSAGMFQRTIGAAGVALSLSLPVVTLAADAAPPQYGGSLKVSPYHPGVSALSWDPGEWNWKVNVDAGPYMELLLAGDLSKGTRNGGKETFVSEAWVPEPVMRGELVESWKVIDKPLSIQFNLRKGVLWQAREGVMKEREMTADDVVYSMRRMIASPKANKPTIDWIDRVEATGPYQVTFFLNRFQAEWPLRLGYGFYSGVVPKEVVDAPNGGASNWRNASGTGPFKITDFVQGNSATYARNPKYWDSETLGGKSYKLPFVDELSILTIKDAQTRMAAFRTGKIDVMVNADWRDMDMLKPVMDKIKFRENPGFAGQAIALRVAEKPFDDIRVRRALNMAVDKQAIVKGYFKGHAAMFHIPMASNWGADYYIPVEKMPADVQELFKYNPEKAKALLAEAGFPKGFTFKMQVSTADPKQVELAQLVAAYLSKVGVTMTIEPMEYGAYLSLMTTGKHGPGYFHSAGLSNPITSLDKLYRSTSFWNSSRINDPRIDKELLMIQEERDEGKRKEMINALTVYAVQQAVFLYLPTPNSFSVWWPWVRNYEGEQAVGAQRNAPIWARVWIDAEQKKKLGF